MITTATIPLPKASLLSPKNKARSAQKIVFLATLWLLIYVAALFSPPLLDDADATHAQAALHMIRSGDWVTLYVDGVRYLEKPPLPYWITALSLRVFGANTFAVHLPLALTVFGLALLAFHWGKRAFGERTAFYAGAFTLTAAGVFLFTRVFIPDALFALLLAISLYTTLRALDPTTFHPRRYAWTTAVALAASVLTKGLVAPFFYLGALAVFLALSGQWRQWRRLFPFSSAAIFLLLAAPWHILAGLRNTGGAEGHGFFWFYFINEHVLRFLGRRIPRDYNKLPTALYWSLHLVWLFPWSLLLPTAILLGWRKRALWHVPNVPRAFNLRRDTVLLLTIFSALVLVFFSLSTNQEYYTLPVYLPVLLLLAAALTRAEQPGADPFLRRTLTAAHAVLSVLGLLIAAALAYGLWTSWHLPYVADIGALLAHRGVGNYTLSMSHFFDLTGASFAALRLPAALAAVAFAVGPVVAWRLRQTRREFASTVTLVLSTAMFLVAAHMAFSRFAPLLSSAAFAQRIAALEHKETPGLADEIYLYGDQAFGSSLPFYLDHRVKLVDGRSTSMLFGSTFADAPPIFVTRQQWLAAWGHGQRKLLFVPQEKRAEVNHALGSSQFLVMESSGKALLTDRRF